MKCHFDRRPPGSQSFGRECRIAGPIGDVVAATHECIDGAHRLTFRPRQDNERVIEILAGAPRNPAAEPVGFRQGGAHTGLGCWACRYGSMWIVTSLTRGSRAWMASLTSCATSCAAATVDAPSTSTCMSSK